MITAHKYLDLNLSLLSVGGAIIQFLQVEGTLKYDELLDKVLFEKGNSAKENFIPALSLLYIFGKIEYQKSNDTIELVR